MEVDHLILAVRQAWLLHGREHCRLEPLRRTEDWADAAEGGAGTLGK
jgi:hypothetical protein